MIRFIQKGFKRKLILTFFFLIFVTSGILSFFDIQKTVSLLHGSKMQNTWSVLRVLSKSLEIGVAAESLKDMDESISDIFDEKDIRYLAVYNGRGRFLHSRAKRGYKFAFEDLSKKEVEHFHEEVILDNTRFGKEPITDFYRPVFLRGSQQAGNDENPFSVQDPFAFGSFPDGKGPGTPRGEELIGFVRAGISFAGVGQEKMSMISSRLKFFLIILVVGLLLTSLVAHRSVRPIQNLKKAALAIGEGNLDQKIHISSGDEISDLAQSFNLMVRKLQVSMQDLAENQKALENEVMEKQKAFEELQKLDKMKDDFISSVSHELRTPLTSIRSFSEILLTYDESKETQEEFLNIINKESVRLTNLINDVLDIQRIESGRMVWNQAQNSLREIVDEAVEGVSALLRENKLSLSVDEEDNVVPVHCDRARVYQVLNNFLSNAIKFSSEGSVIDVHVRAKETAIEVEVADHGIGIEKDNLKSVFDKFQQVGDTLTDKPKGSGLGLAIAREIIEHHGGRIWVESEPGKGSSFFFSIPIHGREGALEEEQVDDLPEEPALNLPGEDTCSEGRLSGKTLLLVEDEKEFRSILKVHLQKQGAKVIEAADGRSAIHLAQKELPDLITLDILMAGLDGGDVAGMLKEKEETKNIPILILSVLDKDYSLPFRNIKGYLSKPVRLSIIIDKIDEILQAEPSIIPL